MITTVERYYLVETSNDYGQGSWAYLILAESAAEAAASGVYRDGKRTGLDSCDITTSVIAYDDIPV